MVVLEVFRLEKVTNREGEIKPNNKGTLMKIIKYRNYNDIDVEFLDDYHFIKEHQAYVNFKSGGIKNPYDKTMGGVGYIGVGKYKLHNEDLSNTPAYEAWTCMLMRCYIRKEKSSTYYGDVTVCDEWLCYQTFAEWYYNHYYQVNERLQLDKDIKNPNSKQYSPENCMLVPQRINLLFVNLPNKRGVPCGIEKQKNGYLAKYNDEKLGKYPTLEEAYSVYANAKENKIKEVADEYKEIIPSDIYDTLVNYKVLIENDKNYQCNK